MDSEECGSSSAPILPHTASPNTPSAELHPSLMASEIEDGKLWPPNIEKHFIDIMIEKERKGKMPNGQFVKGHWGVLQKELNARTNRNYSKAQLTQKCGRLKIAHRTFSELLQRSGMEWDPISNTITASEATWAHAIAANIKYGNYRRKGLAHYDLLSQLFNTGTATGFNQLSSAQPCPDTNEEREHEAAFLAAGVHVDVDADESDVEEVPLPTPAARQGSKRAM